MRSQTWYIRREVQWSSNCLHKEDAKSGVGAIRQGREHLHKQAPFGTAHLFWNSISGVSLSRTMITIRAVQTASVVTPFSRRRRSFRPSATFSGPRSVCSPGIGAAREAPQCVCQISEDLWPRVLSRVFQRLAFATVFKALIPSTSSNFLRVFGASKHTWFQ